MAIQENDNQFSWIIQVYQCWIAHPTVGKLVSEAELSAEMAWVQ
jgi:hypothetical protein